MRKGRKKNDEFIGNVKFFDSKINHFGYIKDIRNSNEVVQSNAYVQASDLLHNPSKYKDDVLVILKLKEDIKDLKGYDVRLLSNCSLIEIIDFIPILDRWLIDGFSEKRYKPDSARIIGLLRRKIRVGVDENLKDKLCLELQQMPPDYHDLIAEMDFERFMKLFETKKNPPPNYLTILLKCDPENFLNQLELMVDDINDEERWQFISKTQSKKVVQKLCDTWKFESIYLTSRLVQHIIALGLLPKQIPQFKKKLVEFICEFGLDYQIKILDYCQDIQVYKSIIDNWFHEAYLDKDVKTILTWLYNNKQLLDKNKRKTNQLRTSLKKWLSKTKDPLLIEYLKYAPSEMLIDFNDVLERWSFEGHLDDLQSLADYLLDQPTIVLSEIFIYKLNSYLDKNLKPINSNIGLAMKWARLSDSPSLFMNFIRDYTFDTTDYSEFLPSESVKDTTDSKYKKIRRLINEPTVTEDTDPEVEELLDYIQELSNDTLSNEDVCLLAFWRTILGLGELPPKETMYDFFFTAPKPLQLLFIKAVFKNVSTGHYKRLHAANYIHDFDKFTDLSAQLLMVVLKHRKSNLSELDKDLKMVLMKSFNDDVLTYIGYMVKPCNGRKVYKGDISFDNNRKTHSFSGEFKKVAMDSPNSEDDGDLPF